MYRRFGYHANQIFVTLKNERRRRPCPLTVTDKLWNFANSIENGRLHLIHTHHSHLLVINLLPLYWTNAFFHINEKLVVNSLYIIYILKYPACHWSSCFLGRLTDSSQMNVSISISFIHFRSCEKKLRKIQIRFSFCFILFVAISDFFPNILYYDYIEITYW